jgi:hypothetical protein
VTRPGRAGYNVTAFFGRFIQHGCSGFTDTARLPVSPVWEIVRDMVERTGAAWKALDEKDILPLDMRKAMDKQIRAVIAKTDSKA